MLFSRTELCGSESILVFPSSDKSLLDKQRLSSNNAFKHSFLTLWLRQYNWGQSKRQNQEEKKKQLSGRLQEFNKEKKTFIVLINTASAFTVWGSFGNFQSNQSVFVIFWNANKY